MGGESTRPEHHGNQNRSRGSLVASIHRKIDRNDTSRMPGPAIVLDGDGFGTEIRKLQRLLQRTPNALGFEGTNTGRESWIQGCALKTLSLANTLSWLISDANCRVSTNSPGTGCDFELWTTAIWKPGERLMW